MLYYVAATRGAHGCNSGIQVTGSHNPKDYNGFKMVLAGRAIYGEDIQRLRRRIEAEDSRRGPGSHRRRWTSSPNTRARIVGDCKLARPMKIVVDSRQRHRRRLGARRAARARLRRDRAVFSEVDGDFPNHHPDPSKPENLADLIAAVARRRRRARPRLRRRRRPARRRHQGRQDHLSRPAADAVRARRALAQPGAPILFDVKCTQRLAPLIRAAGGEPLMWKTGHSLIKAKMKETRRAAGRRDERPHLLQRALVRLRRRAPTPRRACWRSCSRATTRAPCSTRCPTSFSTPELNVACAEGEPHAVVERLRAEAEVPGRARRSSRSTACASNTPTASA